MKSNTIPFPAPASKIFAEFQEQRRQTLLKIVAASSFDIARLQFTAVGDDLLIHGSGWSDVTLGTLSRIMIDWMLLGGRAVALAQWTNAIDTQCDTPETERQLQQAFARVITGEVE